MMLVVKRLFVLCVSLFTAAILTFEVKIFRHLSGNSKIEAKRSADHPPSFKLPPSSKVVMTKTHDFYRLGFSKVPDANSSSTAPVQVVPKLVHYTWFTPKNTVFRFHHMLSILSVHRYVKPNKIVFWCNSQPVGSWWKFAKENVDNIVLVYRQPPTEIFGHPITVAEHQSDVVRIEVLLQYGGIYMDLDVMAVKSFDPLLQYNTTLGAESLTHLGSGVIFSIPNSPFLRKWLDSYRTFDDKHWNYHSVIVPMKIAKTYPRLAHIEWDTIHRPNWMERAWLYSEGKLWDWFSNYAVHLWYRFHNKDYDPESIKYLNTTVGEIFRHVFYGSYEIWTPE